MYLSTIRRRIIGLVQLGISFSVVAFMKSLLSMKYLHTRQTPQGGGGVERGLSGHKCIHTLSTQAKAIIVGNSNCDLLIPSTC